MQTSTIGLRGSCTRSSWQALAATLVLQQQQELTQQQQQQQEVMQLQSQRVYPLAAPTVR
jgi:hypothetical protein